ncbi:MAG: pilus assembly protein PilC [Planctomycetes bacterium DG_58]|nr:MAG: pilus assembly protein PilC [Planctomycetes bacterium DG_58]
MPTYTFQAMNSKGDEVRDEIEASSQEEAVNKIRDLGLFPTRVRQKAARRTTAAAAQPTARRRRSALTIGGVSNKQLCLFTRQLSTLQDAGLPLVRSLKILEGQMKPCKLKDIVAEVGEDVESGSTFSESLAKHPRAFDRLYVNMVRAGEAGGVLDTILERLAEFKEKARRLKRKIVGAMIYPVVVISIAAAILTLIMVYIVPKFRDIFASFGTTLPVPTELLITVAMGIRKYVLAIVLVPFGLYIFVKLLKRTRGGRYFIDNVKLHMPIFGNIVSKSTVSRFSRTLGTLIASGVPILEALNIVRDTTGNEVVSRAIGKVHDSIREGDTIAEPLRASGVVDEVVVNMIDVGEETGELDKMLIKVADNYDDEVDTLVASMMSLMEPLIIVFLGGAVAFIVISSFLPLVKLMTEVGSRPGG